MNQKNFLYLVSGIFGLMFVFHAFRLFFEWEAVFNGWLAPMWISWVALILAGFLAYKAFTNAKHVDH